MSDTPKTFKPIVELLQKNVLEKVQKYGVVSLLVFEEKGNDSFHIDVFETRNGVLHCLEVIYMSPETYQELVELLNQAHNKYEHKDYNKVTKVHSMEFYRVESNGPCNPALRCIDATVETQTPQFAFERNPTNIVKIKLNSIWD